MRNVIMAITLGGAVLVGMAKMPTLATETGYFSKLPEAVQTFKPALLLVGYRHGDQYCQYRECVSYYSCGYYKNIMIATPMAAVEVTTRSATIMVVEADIRASMLL